jgi:hypothetical protein
MSKSIHTPIRRVLIPAMVAIPTIIGSATIFPSSAQVFRSMAECEAQARALSAANPYSRYWCQPIYNQSGSRPSNAGRNQGGNQRLSKGTGKIDRNLKKVGIVVPKGWQRNHLIPDAVVRDNPLMKEARRRSLYDLDRASNILPMPGLANKRQLNPTLIGHQGSHRKYSALINDELNRARVSLIRKYGSLGRVPNTELIKVIDTIERRARTRILQNDPAIPTRFDPIIGTKVLSQSNLLEHALVH